MRYPKNWLKDKGELETRKPDSRKGRSDELDVIKYLRIALTGPFFR